LRFAELPWELRTSAPFLGLCGLFYGEMYLLFIHMFKINYVHVYVDSHYDVYLPAWSSGEIKSVSSLPELLEKL
jgi:hypothetical protein